MRKDTVVRSFFLYPLYMGSTTSYISHPGEALDPEMERVKMRKGPRKNPLCPAKEAARGVPAGQSLPQEPVNPHWAPANDHPHSLPQGALCLVGN